MQPSVDENKPSAVARLMSWADRWFHQGPGRGELDALSPYEFARVAHDLGLSAKDLEELAHHPDDERLPLYERLKLLGLDVDELRRSQHLRDLERTCAVCDVKDTCRHDLADQPQSDAWKAYCGNRTVLEQVARPTDTCCRGKA